MTAAEGKGEQRRMRTIEQQDLTGTTHVVPLWSLLSLPFLYGTIVAQDRSMPLSAAVVPTAAAVFDCRVVISTWPHIVAIANWRTFGLGHQ